MFENILNTPLDHPLKSIAISAVKKLFNLSIKVKIRNQMKLSKVPVKLFLKELINLILKLKAPSILSMMMMMMIMMTIMVNCFCEINDR